MTRIAIYGKGGVGKSTTVSNMAVALAAQGRAVMQIGCDPKADSTMAHLAGIAPKSVLDLVREKGREAITLDDMVIKADDGVWCVEAGGPTPGLGCAGRGIISALELLDKYGAFNKIAIDTVFYDVLGDVVCGGFSMPMRGNWSDSVFIVSSGEPMSIHAAMNIAVAVSQFRERGYAPLKGIIWNQRNVPKEEEAIIKLSRDTGAPIIGKLPYSDTVRQAEQQKSTVLSAYPDSEMAGCYRSLAKSVLSSALSPSPKA